MHFLITAGGTREYIDPVRFISNASSGKMGYALCKTALAAGHKVTLITAATNLPEPKSAKVIYVETCDQMFKAVKENFAQCHCLIMAAAVSDYTPKKVAKHKIKKSLSAMTIELKPTTDILKWAGTNKSDDQIVIGFALEDKAVKAGAEKKLREKNLDMIIANSPAAIGADKSSVQIKTATGDWQEFSMSNKSSTAKKIISMGEEIVKKSQNKKSAE